MMVVMGGVDDDYDGVEEEEKEEEGRRWRGRASDVRPGCKTQRIAPTIEQVADLVCARTKEREYFKTCTCIVGHVNCCLQCATLFRSSSPAFSW
ncbi:hypothetical protein PoB_003190400 [Plakobranchus ocellatus]|uniref:Uncharacterized protein n=1 Tax=Plakobranchus ocellatus TaxID=259542 RepID=A0AAV4AGM4_9GAST|nr:hypothetical protein PoB_003190400 [Plakobranchus ocellatus]